MPTLFQKRDGRWTAEPVSDALGHLWLAPVRFAPTPDARSEPPGVGVLVRVAANGPWALIVHADRRLTHNGRAVAAGFRVLAHKDALAVDGGEAAYFSTEEPARIEPFPGSSAVSCPRCRSDVLPGEPAVKCPNCGVFHHEDEERNCYTYSPTCAVCARSTALDEGLQWTPESL